MKIKLKTQIIFICIMCIVVVIPITSCKKEAVQVATVLPVPPKPPADCSVYFYREDDFALPAYEGEVVVSMNNLTGSLNAYFNTGRGPSRCSSFGALGFDVFQGTYTWKAWKPGGVDTVRGIITTAGQSCILQQIIF